MNLRERCIFSRFANKRKNVLSMVCNYLGNCDKYLRSAEVMLILLVFSFGAAYSIFICFMLLFMSAYVGGI